MISKDKISGGNPYLPPEHYVPDTEPRVFTYNNESRVYIYGSYDSDKYVYGSECYHVFSAPTDNPESWTDHGISFSAKDLCGKEWEGSDILYAPDCVQGADGRYYLYFCTSDQKSGVATSDAPYGPFGNARRIRFDTGEAAIGIDPAVLIDTDGQAYIYWGQFSLCAAKLKADMCTLDSSSYVSSIITGPSPDFTHPTESEKEFMFHEGSSIRKLGGKYYLIYCSIRSGRATSLEYAVSDRPLADFRYGGLICDNTELEPSSWNAHGSIADINGKYYVFYHASTENSPGHRRARVEKIEIKQNGEIVTAENTSLGFKKSLDPYAVMPALYACRLGGGCYFGRANKDGETVYPLLNTSDGCFAAYKYYDFGGTESKFRLTLTVRCHTEGTLEIRLGSPDGTKVGKINLPEGDGVTWQTLTSAPMLLSGEQALYTVFRSYEKKRTADLLSFIFTDEK